MAKCEEILADYKRYKELLFKLSPPEWQEAHRTKNKKDKGNFKPKGISIIITRTKNDLLDDGTWSTELFSTRVLSIITQNVLTGLDIKVSPGGETASLEDSSLSQTPRDTQ